MQVFGTPTPSSLEDGHLTLGKALTAPRFTGHAAGAETPRAESLVVHYDTTVDSVASGTTVVDISGQGNNGTLTNGASYSSSERALTFDGVNDYLEGTLNNPSGAWVHSISFWMKRPNNSTADCVFSIDNDTAGATDTTPHCVIDTGKQLRYDFWSSAVYVNGYPIENGVWYHVCFTYSGGAASTTTVKIYIDGFQRTTFYSGSGNALTASANSILRIGRYPDGNEPFGGSISNFKIWSGVALTAEEVAAEYALGRTGKSLNVTDTAVCIGGTVPRAQLDVRGKIYANGSQSWPIPIASFSNVTPDNTGSAYYTRNIGSIWVYYNTLNFNNDTETIGSPATNSREITLNRKGLYEFHTGSSLSLQGSTASHIGHSIRHISGGVIERYLTDGYEVTQSDYNTVKLVERTQYIKVTEAPVVVGYFLQPTSNRSDRYKEYAYGSSFPIHTVTVKYLG
jgi:hypothetical protein